MPPTPPTCRRWPRSCKSKSALGKAQADFERSSDLFAHNAAAKKDVLAAEAAVVQAKAALDQAQATREQTERRLTLLGLKPGEFGQKITVAAPMSGKVLELLVAQGEYRNDTNAPLITIADLGSVWVASDVPETAIRFIRVGERVDITLAAFPGETFHGRVMRIADTVDPQTRTIKVRAEMENPQGRFRPEMFGSIRHTEGMRSMPVVPVAAIVQGEGHSSVFVEQGARAVPANRSRLGPADRRHSGCGERRQSRGPRGGGWRHAAANPMNRALPAARSLYYSTAVRTIPDRDSR